MLGEKELSDVDVTRLHPLKIRVLVKSQETNNYGKENCI
jgi:hypothetical protein